MFNKICDFIKWSVSRYFLERGNLLLARIVAPRVPYSATLNASRLFGADDDAGLLRLIRGKRLALVGPAPRGSSRARLESYDYVARIGYIGDGSGPESTSERVDLTFLAKWHAQSLLERLASGEITSLNPKTLILLREDVPTEVMSALAEYHSVLRISTHLCNSAFGRVTPNFAPQIIFFLLGQQLEELHVSHVDLMLSPSRPRNYSSSKATVAGKKGWQYPNSTMRRSFSQFHNPFTHFYFFEDLKRISTVTFAEPLKQIIDAGAGQYQQELKKIYYGRD